MSRIFAVLSIAALLLFAFTLMIGTSLGDMKAQLGEQRELVDQLRKQQETGPRHDQESAVATALKARMADLDSLRIRYRLHMLLGVGTALCVVLVNSIAVTYFIGTGRWCREVIDAYELEPALLAQSQRLKRRSFPWAVLGMLTVLAVSALGAASDPGTYAPRTELWVLPHLLAAWTGVALVGWSFAMQWTNLVENHQVIDQIIREVAKVRRERGLET